MKKRSSARKIWKISWRLAVCLLLLGWIFQAIFYNEGRLAWVAHGNADLVSVLDLVERKQVATLATGKGPDGLGWSPLAVEEGARAKR